LRREVGVVVVEREELNVVVMGEVVLVKDVVVEKEEAARY
jgi:hypothetical protein